MSCAVCTMSCAVCTHPQRHQIEQALCLDVQSPRRVAALYALPVPDVLEHQRQHAVWPRRPVAPCLPGMHEPYRYTPPGAPPLCRHCGAALPEDTPHA